MKYKTFLVLMIILGAIITACKSSEAPNSESEIEDPVVTTEGGYPISVDSSVQKETRESAAYPISEPETETEVSILTDLPDSTPDMGIIFGSLFSLDLNEPIAFTRTYVANKVPVEGSDEFIFSIQENSSPQFQTNALGEFIIQNIPPGEYVLIMVTPINTLPILNAEGEEIEITIQGGELLDLGEVFANWPIFED